MGKSRNPTRLACSQAGSQGRPSPAGRASTYVCPLCSNKRKDTQNPTLSTVLVYLKPFEAPQFMYVCGGYIYSVAFRFCVGAIMHTYLELSLRWKLIAICKVFPIMVKLWSYSKGRIEGETPAGEGGGGRSSLCKFFPCVDLPFLFRTYGEAHVQRVSSSFFSVSREFGICESSS